MSHDEAIAVLDSLEAVDFSDGMQAISQDESALREWMWDIDGYEVTLETKFSDGKLASIHYWDANVEVDRYHSLMEHRRIERIDFSGDGKTYELDVIEVIPASP